MTDNLPSETAPNSAQRRGGLFMLGAVAVVGVMLVAVFYYGILHPSSRRVGSGAAPDFEIAAYNGETLRLSDYRGTPVVLNFWASWCVPCRDEQPILESSWRRHQGEVIFLGLDYLDQRPNALAYLSEFDVTYPNGPDLGSRVYTTYHVQGVPETFFIDAEGNVQGFHVGPLSAQQLEQRIQGLLNPVSGS